MQTNEIIIELSVVSLKILYHSLCINNSKNIGQLSHFSKLEAGKCQRTNSISTPIVNF